MHNFIDQSIITRYDFSMNHNKTFMVMVVGLCKAFTVVIYGYSVTIDYYVLVVAACPLVLGIQWLATSGPIETNYSNLMMTFKREEVSHTFHGLRQ